MTASTSNTTRPERRGQWLAWLSCLAIGALAYAWSSPSPQGLDPTGPDDVRAGQLRDHDVPPEGYMMVVAYGKEGEVDRWDGAVDERVMKPTQFIATRKAGEQEWTWNPKPAELPYINTPGRNATESNDQEDRSQSVEEWATKAKARRVVVIVVPHPGEPKDGASRTGMGTQGMGTGRDSESTPPPDDEAAATSKQVDTRAEVGSDVDADRGVDITSEHDTSESRGRGDGDGSGMVDASGENPDVQGTGTNDSGKTRGSPLGSDSPSWIDNPRAEIAIRGGRTPADGGRSGGSAGGEQGGKGNVNGAGWLNLLDVPEDVAPAVAAAMIVYEADVMGFGQKLFSRTVRKLAKKGVARKVEGEVADQARAVVKRRTKEAEARMKAAKPEAPPKEHIDEIMAYMPEELEVAFYRDLGALAHQRAGIYRSMIAQTKNATDDVSEYTLKLARENQAAWRHIEEACETRTRSVRGASTHANTGGSTSGSRTGVPGTSPAPAPSVSSGASSSTAAGASVRTPTAVSTPGHMVSPPKKGGLGPVRVGRRGEARVRAKYNIGPRKAIEIHGRKRIPDGVTDKVLTEVKNVKKLSFTKQLQDYLAIAEEHRLRFDLFVRQDTKLSAPLEEVIRAKKIKLRYIP